MAGDDETTLLPTGHVVTQLLFGREREEVAREASHLGDESRVDSVVDDLENPPILARLHDLPAHLCPPVRGVDSRERDDRDLAAELIVGHLRTLVLVSDEALSKRLLLRRGWKEGHCSCSWNGHLILFDTMMLCNF